MSIDEPVDPTGEWWIDLRVDGWETSVAWRSEQGFGVFATDDLAFGQRPEEVYREPKSARRMGHLGTVDRNLRELIACPLAISEGWLINHRPKSLIVSASAKQSYRVWKIAMTQSCARFSTM